MSKKRFYNFEQFNEAFTVETRIAEAAILEAANKKLWMDLFSSDYLSEEEKIWFSDYLAKNNIDESWTVNESVWDAIKQGVQNMKDSDIGKKIIAKVGQAMDGAKQFSSYVGGLLKKAWDKLIAYFKNKFKGFKDVIKKDFQKAESGGKEIGNNIKEELINLKETMKYWTTDVPANIVKTITGKFSENIVKECLSYNGSILNELGAFDPKTMDEILTKTLNEADDEEQGNDEHGGDDDKHDGHHAQGLFGFLNKMAHAISKYPPFTWLEKVKSLGTAGAKAILKGFSQITKNMGGPGVYEFAVISIVAGGALELYLKHKAAALLDKGLEDVIGAEPVLKMIPMSKTIIHTI